MLRLHCTTTVATLLMAVNSDGPAKSSTMAAAWSRSPATPPCAGTASPQVAEPVPSSNCVDSEFCSSGSGSSGNHCWPGSSKPEATDCDHAAMNHWPARRKLTEGLDPKRFVTAWGAEATWSAVGASSQSLALCVLTHGVLDYERERSAGFVLAPSNGGPTAVFAEDVEQLQMPPLVVLAACQAMAGPARAGDDEAGHLGGAFLTAGTSAFVSAPGNLALKATLDLMNVAFGEWGRGVPFAEALRRARVAVHALPGRSHPYFFSGMSLVGTDIHSPVR